MLTSLLGVSVNGRSAIRSEKLPSPRLTLECVLATICECRSRPRDEVLHRSRQERLPANAAAASPGNRCAQLSLQGHLRDVRPRYGARLGNRCRGFGPRRRIAHAQRRGRAEVWKEAGNPLPVWDLGRVSNHHFPFPERRSADGGLPLRRCFGGSGLAIVRLRLLRATGPGWTPVPRGIASEIVDRPKIAIVRWYPRMNRPIGRLASVPPGLQAS